MHSTTKNVNRDDDRPSRQEKNDTHCCWNEGICLQQILDGGAVHRILLLIYDVASRCDTMTTVGIVNSSKCDTLRHIPRLSHLGDLVKWYQAPGTGAATKVSYASYEDSTIYLSFASDVGRDSTYFSR
jgi:hypothetical protein